MRNLVLALLSLALIAGCFHRGGRLGPVPGDPYAAAASLKLPPPRPLQLPGLHNAFRLSENVYSGSEPADEAAFRALRDLGIRTVVSVDGKAPEVELAARFGLRYVHVPIQYRGFTDEEWLRLAKTFRELEPPFYVHCFHGRHRGPAAAALARLILDRVSREQALAEMRQWCGTSEKYRGLYRDIATRPLPTKEETRRYDWDFPARHPFKGFRALMVETARVHDRLKALAARRWQVDPDHPDLDPVNEAEQLAQLFVRALELPEVQAKPEDFRTWAREAADLGKRLTASLRRAKRGDQSRIQEAGRLFQALRARCTRCHRVYRNE